MREIKFRGLRTDGKGWVYGDLLCNWTTPMILSDADGNEYSIIPSSVGQFVGLKDKNGKDIYEGDLCAVHTLDESPIGVVDYIGHEFAIRDYIDKFGNESLYHHDVIEVVGNIHNELI